MLEGVSHRHLSMLYKKLRAEKRLDTVESLHFVRTVRFAEDAANFSYVMRSNIFDLECIAIGVTIVTSSRES